MSRFARWSAPIRAVFNELADHDALDLVPRLTLMLLVLYAGDYWYVRTPMIVFCTAGFLIRSLYRHTGFWFVICVVMIWGNAINWHAVDNHKYLMTYWCMALCVSLWQPAPAGPLAWTGRVLIGLCFGFAVLWKCMSGDYLDGTFFHYQLLFDGRFRPLAEVLGGVPDNAFYANRLTANGLFDKGAVLTSAAFRGGPRLEAVAQVMTWWTLFIETLVAAAFLVPVRWRLGRWRHLVLLGFAATAYLVAPVIGFGWLLVVMGVAQCDPAHRKTRVLYILVFFLLQLYVGPGRVVMRHLGDWVQ